MQWGQQGENTRAIAARGFTIFAPLQIAKAPARVYNVSKSQEATEQGQQNSAFRPSRSTYFCAVSCFVWRVACERLSVSRENKEPLGIVSSRGKEARCANRLVAQP